MKILGKRTGSTAPASGHELPDVTAAAAASLTVANGGDARTETSGRAHPLICEMQWEWNWPRRIGYSVRIDCWLDLMRSGEDHGPGFIFGLQIGRVILLEFGYYNTHHAEAP